jgi:hypothetical protein
MANAAWKTASHSNKAGPGFFFPVRPFPSHTFQPPHHAHQHDVGGAIVYDCVSIDDANRTVWLVPGQQVKDVMIVEGVFRLLWRPPGSGFPGFWEYRVEGARRSR